MIKRRAIHRKTISIATAVGIYLAPIWPPAEVYPSHEQQT